MKRRLWSLALRWIYGQEEYIWLVCVKSREKFNESSMNFLEIFLALQEHPLKLFPKYFFTKKSQHIR